MIIICAACAHITARCTNQKSIPTSITEYHVSERYKRFKNLFCNDRKNVRIHLKKLYHRNVIVFFNNSLQVLILFLTNPHFRGGSRIWSGGPNFCWRSGAKSRRWSKLKDIGLLGFLWLNMHSPSFHGTFWLNFFQIFICIKCWLKLFKNETALLLYLVCCTIFTLLYFSKFLLT